MSNPFEDYGKRATTTAATPLVGVIKRRADARTRYTEIVAELQACATVSELDACTAKLRPELAQFAAELEFLWLGDGEFRGLKKEIEWAQARVDDRLDFPRWEVSQIHDVIPAS